MLALGVAGLLGFLVLAAAYDREPLASLDTDVASGSRRISHMLSSSRHGRSRGSAAGSA
jgi:hypothetical protein